MAIRYPNLLSPVKVGNTFLKNRFFVSPSMGHFIQGPEPYPSQAMIDFFAARAKSGAAVVTVGCALPKGKRPAETGHAAKFDYEDVQGQNYFAHLTEAIHFHGAKASLILDPPDVPGVWDVSPGMNAMRPKGSGFAVITGAEVSREKILEMVEEYVDQAKIAKACGFDMVTVHASYRFFMPSRFLSPLTNHRTDEFGGSRENRVRFLKMVCTRIKEECGKNFLVDVTISGEEPEGGFTTEDVIAWAHMLGGCVDIMQIRAGEIDPNHPTGYNPEKTPFLRLAAAVKASNPPMLIAAIGGFLDLDDCERAIAEGKADIIAGARAWISNPDYGIKAYEGRNEDIVPCIRCNKCHIPSRGCPGNSVCSVNPTWGSIAARLPQAVDEPSEKKKIAVIGGGPAGMEAALIANERGHEVTLYEKNSVLGGQLLHADHAKFKWPLRKFKNYLIKKVKQSSIDVHLNTEAEPGMLKNQGYDHVIVAIGSEPIKVNIPGLDTVPFQFASEVFISNKQETLGKKVVIIGGGDIGVETGLYLAETGHEVFVIEAQEALCIDSTPVHYRAMVEEYWLAEKNFSFAVNARCSKVSENGVFYLDSEGTECFVECENILLAVGMRPKTATALSFFGNAMYTSVIGDCDKPSSVQRAMRMGYQAGVKL